MRVVAIIQARMGSSRLPGKVLMPLAGKPVLWHLIHRLRNCQHIDEVAVATSTNPGDDALEKFCKGEGVPVVRGSENNVLERYVQAATELHADVIIRVCGDSPLVDPYTLDLMIAALIESKADRCLASSSNLMIHEGFTPITTNILLKLASVAGDDPVAREHVTASTSFWQDPGYVKTTFVEIGPEYQFSGARVSVDTPADLRFLEEVYARLKAPAGEADIRDVVKLLRMEPELLAINNHVHQKRADEITQKVLIRCDGDTELGLGHVRRCLNLANKLRDVHGFGVVFAMATGLMGFEAVRQEHFPIEQKNDEPEDVWLGKLIKGLKPDALILDVRSDLASDNIEQWRKDGLLIITIDDPSDRRLVADMAFYPPVPQVQKMDWNGFNGELYVGWEWVVLGHDFGRQSSYATYNYPTVLVTMGGSDPAGLTLRAMEALDLLEGDFKTIVVLGPGFRWHDPLNKLLVTTRRHFDVRQNVEDMASIIGQSDLAIASFGVTAYELATMGVPAIYLCLTEDHAESASDFEKAGMAKSLGVYENISKETLSNAVDSMIRDRKTCLTMGERARQLVDGKGAERIAGVLLSRFGDSQC